MLRSGAYIKAGSIRSYTMSGTPVVKAIASLLTSSVCRGPQVVGSEPICVSAEIARLFPR